ncbi:MAG: hypothetical protein LBG94_05715 [Treponema sp.]|jgi:hypothetical protein|nr:hypothetical protein [Treponema sp.]
MRKIFFAVFITLFASAALFAGPMDEIQGLVSYSESVTVFFNSEANALRWIEKQNDFMLVKETTASYRRLFAAAMENLIPNFSLIMTTHSDFCVMVSRLPEQDGSTLILVVRGEITRLWQY